MLSTLLYHSRKLAGVEFLSFNCGNFELVGWFLDVDEFSHEHVVILHNFECGIEGVWMNKCIMLLLWIRCGGRIRVVSLCRGRNGIS